MRRGHLPVITFHILSSEQPPIFTHKGRGQSTQFTSRTIQLSHDTFSAFTHSCHVSHGHGHDHHSTHYLYTTHGCDHHSHGASLHYHNHQLHMHVHDDHHHHHHHVVAPYNPVQGVVNHIVSSFRYVLYLVL